MPVHYELKDNIAVIAADNPPVNALGAEIRSGLSREIARAVKEGAKAIVIYGVGRTWFAGADIREFGKPPIEPMLPAVCNEIEACPVPVIAAMHGTIFGGGLEVALGCHYRVAAKSSRLGLPEVTLGLLPGAGGTQRLPRLTGYQKAISMITSGRPVAASEALASGIIDKLVEDNDDPKAFGIAYAVALLADNAEPRPVRELPLPEPVDFDALKTDVVKKARGQLSPVNAFEAIKAASRLPFAEGLLEERRLFQQLMETDQRKGLIHAFFGERQVVKLPETHGVAARDLQKTGVIGGGTMGAGIATSALLAGCHVTLIEMSQDAADNALKRISNNLSGALKRGKIDQSAYDELLQKMLNVSLDYATLHQADLIIEAVFENIDVKKQVFAQIEAVAKPGAVLASNTSYLDINEIAKNTSRPADVIGLHFFSPAHVMRLLEVVVGDNTAVDVTATGFAFGKLLGKVCVRSGVCDGFIGNRILGTYRTAADHMVLDGASPYDIDRVLEDFGFAMGPFAVADLAGLDIGWANRKRLAPMRDARERVANHPDQLCEDGHYGQKTGKGYYIYDGRSKTVNPDVLPLIEAERLQLGIKARVFSDDEILRRYMAAMINEAAKVVEEGIARRPVDVDVVLLTGYGFPRYRGGPMKWADLHGLSKILADIETFAKQDNYFWQAAPLLQRLVAEGGEFDHLNKAD